MAGDATAAKTPDWFAPFVRENKVSDDIRQQQHDVHDVDIYRRSLVDGVAYALRVCEKRNPPPGSTLSCAAGACASLRFNTDATAAISVSSWLNHGDAFWANTPLADTADGCKMSPAHVLAITRVLREIARSSDELRHHRAMMFTQLQTMTFVALVLSVVAGILVSVELSVGTAVAVAAMGTIAPFVVELAFSSASLASLLWATGAGMTLAMYTVGASEFRSRGSYVRLWWLVVLPMGSGVLFLGVALAMAVTRMHALALVGVGVVALFFAIAVLRVKLLRDKSFVHEIVEEERRFVFAADK